MKQYINDLSRAFETKTRNNGEEFTALKSSQRDRFADAVRSMHGTDFLPDDFRYSTIDSIISMISGLETENLDASDLRDLLDDSRHEIVDGLVAVYNKDLTRWLDSDLRRAGFVDDAVDEFGFSGDTFDRIKLGQYREIDEIYSNIVETLAELAEEKAA